MLSRDGVGSCSSCMQQQHLFNGPLSGITQVSQYQEGKTNMDLLEQDTVNGSGISWAVCKSAPYPRQLIMPAPHQTLFYRPYAFSATQPMASRHCCSCRHMKDDVLV